jgi:hypothetical protein
LREWSLDSQLAAPRSRTRLTGCGMEMSTRRSRRRGEGSGGEERRGEERRGKAREGEAGRDTLIRKHPHLWRGDRGLFRRQRASAVMAEGGCWAAGPFSTLKEDLGPLAATWSPGHLGWKVGGWPGQANAHCTLRTAHYCTVTFRPRGGLALGRAAWTASGGRIGQD